MKLVIDTKVLIWIIDSPERLSAPAKAAIENGANEVFVSGDGLGDRDQAIHRKDRAS